MIALWGHLAIVHGKVVDSCEGNLWEIKKNNMFQAKVHCIEEMKAECPANARVWEFTPIIRIGADSNNGLRHMCNIRPSIVRYFRKVVSSAIWKWTAFPAES